MEPKLKARLWVQAQIRACMVVGISATVVRRGDPDAGAILLKINQFDAGCSVLTQARDAAGQLVWMRATGPAPVPEADADAYIARQVSRDDDLWVVEIEDRTGKPPINGTVVE
jgi:GMP synthase (glutamine-hydrolysing)